MASTIKNNLLVDFQSPKFFVLRTPLLPAEEFDEWTQGLHTRKVWEASGAAEEVEHAFQQDVKTLRSRLRAIIDRPEIRHALFVASPSLDAGIEDWKTDPSSKKGRQAERSLVRYFTRMTARPTPFGLFSGCSVGLFGQARESDRLQLVPRRNYQSCSRLDFDYLFALTAGLQSDPKIAWQLKYLRNSSLYKIADSWHYVESRIAATQRTHHLVQVESDEFLEAVLERACREATVEELTEIVVRQSGEPALSSDEAKEFILQLISNGVLVSTLSPLVTGDSPLDDLIGQTGAIPEAASATEALRVVRKGLNALDEYGLGVASNGYRELAEKLRPLPGQFDIARLFQVDLIKPVHIANLTEQVVNELFEAANVLCRVAGPADSGALRPFREAFTARYDQALVPLLEALDDEHGIGFGNPAAESAPLIRGLQFNATDAREQPGSIHMLLNRRLFDAPAGPIRELQLKPDEIPANDARFQSLPDSFVLEAVLVAPSQEALEHGDFQIKIDGSAGPNGMRFFGRFCHADPRLKEFVMQHLRQEEAAVGDAVFAEIVHLPEGRLGNVLCRPVLRDLEIVYLGRSGAAVERQILASDLLVGVEGDEVRLYSRQLGKRVIPRLTNAHGFTNSRLSSVYRFLCQLQHDRGIAAPWFSWGDLDKLDYLPRLRVGRVILALARWLLNPKEIKELGKHEGRLRFWSVQEWRDRCKLPRWITLQEADNALLVDLDNPLSVDAFVHVLKRRTDGAAVVREVFPGPDELCVTGPEGHFYHELHVPFVRRAKQTESSSPQKDAVASLKMGLQALSGKSDRTLPPGSDWLYLKVYCGFATQDEVIDRISDRVVRAAIDMRLIDRWFFIRYADPQHHLRIRFRSAGAAELHQLIPRVTSAVNPFLQSGKAWKIQFDTYEREIERYGGLEGTVAAEELFHADSDAVVEVMKSFGSDGDSDRRWRVALLGIDVLLSDCRLELPDKRDLVKRVRDSLHSRLRLGTGIQHQLGDRFRTERKKLEALLQAADGHDGPIALAAQAFARRSERLAPVVAKLQLLSQKGLLTTGINDLASSYVHMFVNRLIRSSANAHEFVLHDFLFRLYDGQMARAKSHLKERNDSAEAVPCNE